MTKECLSSEKSTPFLIKHAECKLHLLYFGQINYRYSPRNPIYYLYLGKTYFYCVQWYRPFWKRMGGFWRRIRKININIWIWNQVCASEKLRTAKEIFLTVKIALFCYTKPGDLWFIVSKLLYTVFIFFLCHSKWQFWIVIYLLKNP